MKIVLVCILAIILSSAAQLARADLDDVRLPDGFVIEDFAEVPNARSMALGQKGTVFVSNRRKSAVYAIDRSAGSREVIELMDGLNTPNGIAFHDGDLYVAEIDRVTRYADIENRLRNVPKAEVLPIDLPSERHHGWRYLAIGPDGKLYISIGAPCNVCDEEGFASIISVNADGSEREEVARGVRNSVGFTWHPTSDELWFTDNGRDMLGDDIPACELNRITTAGEHFGFPYCHGGDVSDPKFGDQRSCNEFTAPVQKLGPHVAPLGLIFYNGQQFPEAYRGDVFIAEHGSWNRSKKIGYRITRVTLEDNTATSYTVFASGWLQGQSASGRPVDLLQLEDGSLLVSDDHAGMIYRIYYSGTTD